MSMRRVRKNLPRVVYRSEFVGFVGGGPSNPHFLPLRRVELKICNPKLLGAQKTYKK